LQFFNNYHPNYIVAVRPQTAMNEDRSQYANAHLFLTVSKYVTICVTLSFLIGVLNSEPAPFIAWVFFVKSILACFLIYRFNPYRSNKIIFNSLDRRIIYSSGVYILVLSFAEFATTYVSELRTFIQRYTLPVIKFLKSNI